MANDVQTAPGQTSAGDGVILLFSSIVRQPIRNTQGTRVGILKDLVVRIGDDSKATNGPYLPLKGLVAKVQGQDIFVPWAQVATLNDDGVHLGSARMSLERFERRDGEILLGHDVLDKQLIDVTGVRVIRVNDLGLARLTAGYCLVAVDISFRSLLRRIGVPINLRLRPLTMREMQALPRQRRTLATPQSTETFLDWGDVDYFASNAPDVRLTVSHAKLARLHPVEIARLVDSLSHVQGTEILAALDTETAADTLEELSPERQADILEELDEERAADILDEMEPDAAANVLADLDEPKAQALLDKMEADEAEDVKDLLQFDPDSAGGYMNNAVITLPANFTVSAAIAHMRALDERPPMFYYLYLVQPDTDYLVGVVTVQDLILAEADTPLTDLVERDVLQILPDAPAADAARLMAEYNLLALPVVDAAGMILGVITADDAMQVILPAEWKRRIPHIYH